ncbi:MAG TPA: DUF4190 domain-containing protein [Verrucomicrobiae bacterium]|nr:DUF4190 domain-containing protein [Verrucomicrobiae bacterium]
MNYTIIGNDGKRYGPITADQLRQWIKQSRVESRTPVFVQGTADWTFVGLLPEFAAEFPENPPVITPPRPGNVAGTAVVPSQNSSLATWGFICGLLSWTFCGCCAPVAIAGLTFSIIALVQINARTEPIAGRGFAIAGLVLSATSLVWSLCLTLVSLFNNSAQMPFNIANVVNGQ